MVVFTIQYFDYRNNQKEALEATTELIQTQLKNVGKLIVTEGNYAQVFTYRDSKKFYFDVLSAEKKALVVVNAKAMIAYDLSQIETEINKANKTLTITSIPAPELTIIPQLKYYDIEQDYLNQFEAADYNKIKKRVEQTLRQKILASELVSSARNRLISELQEIYILTNAMGWELRYKQQPIEGKKDWQKIPAILRWKDYYDLRLFVTKTYHQIKTYYQGHKKTG